MPGTCHLKYFSFIGVLLLLIPEVQSGAPVPVPVPVPVPIPVSPTPECHIRVQVCEGQTDPWKVGFIEVNNDRIHTWLCPDTTPTFTKEGYYMAAVTASCREVIFKGRFISNTNFADFRIFDLMDSLYDLLHRTPTGGYAIIASTGGYQNLRDLYYNLNDTIYSGVLADLGLVFEDNNVDPNAYEYLESPGDNVQYNLPRWLRIDSDEDALAIVARKFYPKETVVKIIGKGHGPRTIDVQVNYPNWCIQPLTPLDSVMIDPENYGISDNVADSISAKMHVDYGNRIGCSGNVYAFEYIPANNATDIHAGMFRYSNDTSVDPEISLIESRLIQIQSDSITTNLIPQYNCFRTNPIRSVLPGDMYGYYTDSQGSSIAPPLKVVYTMQYTNTKYPCSRQFSSGEASKILLFNRDSTTDLTVPFELFSGLNQQFDGAMGLRPIFDPEFVNTCECTTNNDCYLYGDYNMECQSGQCQCETGYVYSRKLNLCVNVVISLEKNAIQISTLNTETGNEASVAVDNSTDSKVLTGTCSKTAVGANPWWVVDLGGSLNVHAVEVKSLTPLDVFMELWITKPTSGQPPDQLIVRDYYNITAQFGITQTQQLTVHGPFPWLLLARNLDDRSVLNRNYQDGLTTYTFDGSGSDSFGSVGIEVSIIKRIVNFGFIQQVGGLNCWEVNSDTIDRQTISAGSKCTGIVVYIEEAENAPGRFIIRQLSNDRALTLSNLSPGSEPAFIADRTTLELNLVNFLDENTGDTIRPANDLGSCLEYDVSGNVVLGTTCTSFYLKKIFDDTIPVYSYTRVDFNASAYSQPPFQYVTGITSALTRPCYEIVDATSLYAGIINYVNDNNGVRLVAVNSQPYDVNDVVNGEVLIRTNDVGVHDFTVGVSSEFDSSRGFDAKNFTTCSYFFGAPINGRNFILECDAPIYGRYVAIYLKNGNVNEKLQLCDVKVHTLGGAIHNSICTTDAECQVFRDGGSGDQHLVCSSVAPLTEVVGKCICKYGYVYHKEAQMCIDIDECEDPLPTTDPIAVAFPDVKKCQVIPNLPIEGKVNGTCVNTPGAFYCECPDGYTFERFIANGNLLRGYCVDIDETTINNCGCEYNCTNGRVDIENFKYFCACPKGYRLSRNGHSCEDIDECFDSNTYVTATCIDISLVKEITNIDYIGYCEMECATTLDCVAVRYDNASGKCVLTSSCNYIEYNKDFTLYSRKTNEPKFFPIFDHDCPGNTDRTITSFEDCQKACVIDDTCVAVVTTVSSTNCALKTKCNADGIVEPGTHIYFVKKRTAGKCRDLYEKAQTENVTGYQPTNQCDNSVGDYTCKCEDGYEYNTNFSVCLNINECPGLCEGQCTDVIPAVQGVPYICDCGNLPGYQLGPDNYSCIDINECLEEGNITNNCTYNSTLPPAAMYMTEPVEQYYQAFCRNIIASYYCECPPGFEWNAMDYLCEDVNECTSPLRIHECEDICINTNGTYLCDCFVGYKFSLNNHSCEDIDECSSGPSVCITTPPTTPISIAGNCQNTIGSYFCSCDKGYEWRNDSGIDNCYDINECEVLKPCEDHCVNKYVYSDGITHECFCNDPGYKVSNNSGTCIDINECTELVSNDCTGDNNATCQNTLGSYHCNCPEGYIWHETMKYCDDLNECDYNSNGECSHVCNNVVGSYFCTCRPGYILTNDNNTCEDLDECAAGLNSCSDDCVNELGSYRCICKLGRALGTDKATCSDINECQTDNNGGCEQICTNTIVTLGNPAPPRFQCTCQPGFGLSLNTRSCDDVDECTLNTNNCQLGCMNTYGSFKCTCPKGYALNADKRSCDDINECNTNNGMCEDTCTNSDGNYECSCSTGYKLWTDGHSCKDINECVASKKDCAGEFSICINTPGSYRCVCDRNYILSIDGRRCVGPNFVEVRSALNLVWDPKYADTTSVEYKNIAAWLNVYFGKVCANLGYTEVANCKVKGPLFPSSGTQNVLNVAQPSNLQGGPQNIVIQDPALTDARIGFNIDVVTDNALSEALQGSISYNLYELIQKDSAVVPINNTQVGLVTDLQFVYTPQNGVESTWVIRSPCDFYIQTKFCLNGGSCKLTNGAPVCKCTKGYGGSRCAESPLTTITDTDIGMIAGISVLGILVLILMIIVVMVARRRVSPNVPDILHREPLTYNSPWRGAGYQDMCYNMYK